MTDRAWEVLHGWATVAWFVLIPVVVLTDLARSPRFLAGLVVVGALLSQLGAWHTARAARQQAQARRC